MIKVRVGQPEDLDTVLRLNEQVKDSVRHRSDFFRFESDDILFALLNDGNLLIAEYKDKPAGMVSVVTAKDWWYIVALVVDKEHRGLGVAGELLMAAKTLGAGRGASRGAATAAPDLVDFYSKNGFTPVATVMECVWQPPQ